MRKYFINSAKRLDFILFSFFILFAFIYGFSYLNKMDIRYAVDHETGIEGLYDILYTATILLLIPISYFFTQSLSLGILSMIRNECFHNGDIVLVKSSKSKKTYAATVVMTDSFIKKANKTNISIYDGEVIEIPTENIVRILDN